MGAFEGRGRKRPDRGAHGWFASTLELVGVGSQAWSFAKAAGTQEGFLGFAGDALSHLDTGISRLVVEPVGFEALPKDASLRRSIAELGDDGVIAVVFDVEAGDYGFEMLTVRSVEGRPEVQRLRTVRVGPDGRSELVGLAEFKDIRFDKDLVRSYLDGRFGGIPMLGEGCPAAGSEGFHLPCTN